MLLKKLSDITLSDINDLISNEVSEGKSLEYKSELTNSTRDEKKEFLADITSFANSDGGDIIFGIKEDSNTKLPLELVGISIDNRDLLIQKIENMLRDSVEPRMPEIEFSPLLPLCDSNNKYIFIIRVRPSFSFPHRVMLDNKFYARNSVGKYPMDVGELRTSFTLSHAVFKEINSYIEERLVMLSRRGNGLITNKPVFMLNYIPISAFRGSQTQYSMKQISHGIEQLNSTGAHIRNICGFFKQRITVDGVTTGYYTNTHSARIHHKINGIVEMATTDYFFPQHKNENRNPSEPYDVMSSVSLVGDSISLTGAVKTFYNELGISSPVIISCAILNGIGYSLPKGFCGGFPKIMLDNHIIAIPPIMIDDFSAGAEEILKPVFDSIWNAFGRLHCSAYNQVTGKYIGFLNRNEVAF